jgi:hypothetical protein
MEVPCPFSQWDISDDFPLYNYIPQYCVATYSTGLLSVVGTEPASGYCDAWAKVGVMMRATKNGDTALKTMRFTITNTSIEDWDHWAYPGYVGAEISVVVRGGLTTSLSLYKEQGTAGTLVGTLPVPYLRYRMYLEVYISSGAHVSGVTSPFATLTTTLEE